MLHQGDELTPAGKNQRPRISQQYLVIDLSNQPEPALEVIDGSVTTLVAANVFSI